MPVTETNQAEGQPAAKPRRRRVKRGLLTLVEQRTPFRITTSTKERVERKMEALQKAPLGGYAWKEAWQEFKHLSKSRPNLHGRRLLDEKAISKAQYVTRVAYRAWKGRSLPHGRSWGHLRTAVTQVYRELT